jgi:hypothetical protein
MMLRLLSLIVFMTVGILIAWLTRNAGMTAGTAFLVAFVPAFGAAWGFEWVAAQLTKRQRP